MINNSLLLIKFRVIELLLNICQISYNKILCIKILRLRIKFPTKPYYLKSTLKHQKTPQNTHIWPPNPKNRFFLKLPLTTPSRIALPPKKLPFPTPYLPQIAKTTPNPFYSHFPPPFLPDPTDPQAHSDPHFFQIQDFFTQILKQARLYY